MTMAGFITLIYPSTVTDYNTQLQQRLDATNSAVQACTQLDPVTKTDWNLFYAAASSFTKEDVGLFGLGSRMDQAESYAQELMLKQQNLSKTCNVGAIFDPTPPGANDLVNIIQYLAWGAGTVAVAYIVGQFVSVIPKPAPPTSPPPTLLRK